MGNSQCWDVLYCSATKEAMMPESTLGNPIPLGTVPAIEHEETLALPAPPPTSVTDPSALFGTMWQLAMIPAITWMSVASASWRGWERTVRGF